MAKERVAVLDSGLARAVSDLETLEHDKASLADQLVAANLRASSLEAMAAALRAKLDESHADLKAGQIEDLEAYAAAVVAGDIEPLYDSGLAMAYGHALNEIAALKASGPMGSETGGGADHPQASSPVPQGLAFVRFCAVRPIPGGMVSAGLVMENPPYEVLQTTSYVWITQDEYDAAPRRLRMVRKDDGSWLVVEDR